MEGCLEVLGVPPEYSAPWGDHYLLLCSRAWIKDFQDKGRIPESFPRLGSGYSPKEITAILAERTVPALHPTWTILQLQSLQIQDGQVSVCAEGSPGFDFLAFPEALSLLRQCNTANLANQARKKYSQGSRLIKTSQSNPWTTEIVRVFKSLYPSHVTVDTRDTVIGELSAPSVVGDTELQSFLPLRCSVVTESCILLLFDYEPHSLSSISRYSPAFLGDNPTKLHFIAFQIVKIFKTFQDLQLNVGEIQLKDLFLLKTLHLRLRPRMNEILVNIEIETTNQSATKETASSTSTASRDSICDIVDGWTQGKVSNLDYILYLNKLAGRRVGDPNFHPVVPWITDFSSKEGKLRDLTKSKFRLNKGDEMLDRTYESGDHHVTAVLSEITYYTYLARRTDQRVLRKYVRPNWVPEEYPRSIQRLQEWSPDESIPEFFMDPSVFSSIHEDLPDLELPDWMKSGEDFISWHRGMLESEPVSRQLHAWIDLTFGYKLSGQAAIKNKNVCLDFSEGQRELREQGVVQLFSQPHPPRQTSRFTIPKSILDSAINVDLEDIEEDTLEPVKNRAINLPVEYNPTAELSFMESLHSFVIKSDVNKFKDKRSFEDNISRKHNYLLKVKPMQLLGCLICELFFPKKFRGLGDSPSFEARYRNSVDLLMREEKNLNLCVRGLLRRLLLSEGSKPFSLSIFDRYAAVSDQGLPLPSAELLLDPILGGYFPVIFDPILQTLSTVETLSKEEEYAEDIDVQSVVAEFQVKLVARRISPLLDGASEEIIDLVVPLYLSLIESSRTAVQASWYLLDKIGSVLGPDKTREIFLEPILSHYKNLHTTKHIKLYHRSFMLVLMTRLRLSVFLESFSNILIEATGGNREFPETPVATPTNDPSALIFDAEQSQADGEIFSFDSWDSLGHNMKQGLDSDTLASVVQSLKHSSLESIDVHAPVPFVPKDEDSSSLGRKENSVVQISKETLLWLTHRLGPVLTAKHISRNLLRMMSLCFLPPEGLEPTEVPFPDQQIRLSPAMLSGDSLSLAVLECLRKTCELYGDHFILVQYLPYCWDLASLCRRKVSPNLEGGLLGALAVIHSVIPLLSDSILMKELDNITSQILCPVIHAATSSHNVFTSGSSIRAALLFKSLDVLYLIGLRIGEEMSRTHLSDLVAGLLTSFSKVFEDASLSQAESHSLKPPHELTEVLTKKMAYTVYIPFHLLLGGQHLEDTVPNIVLIKKLCLEHQKSLISPAIRPYTYREIQHTLPFYKTETSFSGSGNMIIVNSVDDGGDNTSEVSKLIHAPSATTRRHLRGNWLAYWEHELGRNDKEGFNLKQIRLQSWTGHQGSIKTLAVLDNENSFLSGGKDRTVRLWSLRNSGEEEFLGTAQWVYNGHRKPVFSVGYLAQKGIAVSCDGTIHVWDPFVGGLLAEYEGLRGSPFCVMTPQSFGQSIVSATSEGNLALIDTRMKGLVDLKVSFGMVGLIRSICASEDGSYAAVGHSSGYISILDLRAGRIKSGMKGHDGEVLTLTTGNNYFVSTSLDQTACVYQWEDGKLWTQLRTPAEPLHCVVTNQDQIITGSTNHKVSVHSISPQRESHMVVSKLRSDIIKGNLIQMEILPQNRLLLLATDIGNIHLVC